eukprot:gnl/Dysnectes_brevis/615_a680_1348.p3 GENE.gnl/Dysnectes_brevis/615_a680_1348~~gnl/Dysnectes_brevis/615_a680_1348.p3  ORF type:complete len:355 (+),score=92.48 gnl/Dysnectes_brevis/615_a680_1348:161-1066(+)
MKPYTFDNLKARRSNKLKDFISVAGPLGVTHMLILTSSGVGTTLRIIRSPHGPTFTFRIEEYSGSTDLRRLLPEVATHHKPFSVPPLVILNGFSGESLEPELRKTLKLTAAMLKGMYPTLDVGTTAPADVRRVVLWSVDREGLLHLRHYAVSHRPGGVDDAVAKVVEAGRGRSLNFMEGAEDFDELLGVRREAQTRIRLLELGPRIRLRLLKVESRVSTGLVMYHHSIKKSPKEIAELEKRASQTRGRIEADEKREIRRQIARNRQERMKEDRRVKAHGDAQEDLLRHADSRVLDQGIDKK